MTHNKEDKMKSILLALSLVSTPLLAQESIPRPEGMYDLQVPIQLNCMDNIADIVDSLAKDFGEAPVMMAHMSPTTTMIWFTNKDHTSTTLVVTKKKGDGEEACIMWNGSSPEGMGFSLNPEPNFPKPPPAVKWNEA